MNVCEHPRRTVQKTELEILLSGAQVMTRSKEHKMKYKQFNVNIRNTYHVRCSNTDSDCPERLWHLRVWIFKTCPGQPVLGDLALSIGVWLHNLQMDVRLSYCVIL